MKKRKNIIIILSSLFVFQILLIVILNVFSSQKIKSRAIEKNFLNNVKKENITSIEISDYKDSFLIEKKKDKWYVKTGEKYIPSDSVKLYSYLNILEELSQGIIRDNGTSPEAEKTYGFDKESYQKVTLQTDKNKSFTVYIGKTGPQRGTSYLRYNKEKKIREVKSIIATETGNQPIKWAQTRIFDQTLLEDLERCEIESNFDWFRGHYSIRKEKTENEKGEKKEQYVIEPPVTSQKLKPFAVENIVTGIVNLTIDDYKFDGDISQKEKLAEIKLILFNNKTFQIDIYPADKDDIAEYLIDVDFNDYLYLVGESDIKKFIKSKDELIEKNEK